MAKKRLKIESFRPGTHTSAAGQKITFTADEVRAIASGYDAENAPAPIVVGHPKTDDPAFGWCAAFSFNEDSQRLIADTGELDEKFAASIEGGSYKKVSMALFSPDHPANPKPGQYYPRHLGFLGAAAPAVTGLKPVHFAAEDADSPVVEIEFGEAPGWIVQTVFRNLRDYFVEKFGREDADKLIPNYLVEGANPPEREQDSPTYQAPAPATIPTENDDMTPEQKAEMDRLAALAATQATELDALRRANANAATTAFCATLIEQKRLTPAEQPAVLAALVAIDAVSAVEFSGAEAGTTVTKTPAEIIRGILSARNPLVSDTELTADDQSAPNFSTAARPGVDPASAALHAKVLAYQAAHAGTEYAVALNAVVSG